jgi:transcriptional regulator with XRE-family HTH domain
MATTYSNQWQLASLHERLRAEREALGPTQEAFADQMGLSRSSQLRLENGRALPALDYLKAAGELGIDVQFVLTGIRGEAQAGGAVGATEAANRTPSGAEDAARRRKAV